MIKRKNEVVAQTTSGLVYLMKKNKITVYHGVGSFVDKNTVKVTKDDGSYSIGDVPPGTYKVKAWHEALGQKEFEVTVAAAGTATSDFAFEPK